MATSPNSWNNTVRPDFVIRAKSGTITETIGNFVTSPFRRRHASSFTPSHKLSQMIYNITLKDIEGATRCGGGGFGAVWVLDLPKKGKVALKQLRVSSGQAGNDLVRRTLREGETWKDLNHPSVLSFLGILETPTDLYLISPYVENGSLDDYLRKHPDADRGLFLCQTAGGIAYLHKCGIVHGDIKAANILVSNEIHALLCDFGLARIDSIATSVGLQGVGTIRFQSPELLHQGGGKTPASDAWAFGMTIYEVLSGNIPFQDYPNPRMIDAVANKGERPPRSPSHSPSGALYDLLWNVAEDCWEKDPTKRLAMQDAHKRVHLEYGLMLRGHTLYVASVAFSPDGRTVVSGSWDHTVRLWDVESASPQGGVLKGHTHHVSSVAFSPDGRTVVSGSYDFTVRLWDVKSAIPRGGALNGHTHHVSSVAFSPDGRTIVSGSYDHTVRLWDVESASPRGWALKGHTQWVTSVAFSPDGRTVVSGSWDHTIRLWDVESASAQGEALQGHTDWVSAVAFSPDGMTVVSGSGDNTVRLWDVESASPRGRALQGQTDRVRSVAFSPDGRTVVSGANDNTVQLWDVKSASLRGGALKGNTSRVNSVAFSSDGRTVVSGSDDNTVRLWDVSS